MYPYFTIVTVCLNAGETINVTLSSVLEQKYNNFEYLIIDGASTDKTLKNINNFQMIFQKRNIPLRLISECDTGIYNAMNKAIDLANGEWLVFMNAGDRFYDSQSLEIEAQACSSTSCSIVYGDSISQKGKYFKYTKCWNEEHPMPFCHQACATRKDLLIKYHFNEKYRICADYEFYVRLWQQNISRLYIKKPLAIYRLDGISSTNYLQQIKERNQIKVNYSIFTQQQANDTLIQTQRMLTSSKNVTPCTLWGRIRQNIKKILPNKLKIWYQKRQKHRLMIRQGWQTHCP